MTRHGSFWSERPWKGVHFLVLEEAGISINGRGGARIPYRLHDGRLLRERFSAPGRAPWWGPGDRVIPFGLETLPPTSEACRHALFVCEGESDALSVREAFAEATARDPISGYRAIALPGALTWRSDWRVYLEPFPRIYLLGDGDGAGREMNVRVKRDVPWARPVWLPNGEDCRSLLQREGPRALDEYIARADETAHLWAAFIKAGSLDELEELLRREIASRDTA